MLKPSKPGIAGGPPRVELKIEFFEIRFLIRIISNSNSNSNCRSWPWQLDYRNSNEERTNGIRNKKIRIDEGRVATREKMHSNDDGSERYSLELNFQANSNFFHSLVSSV